ncbi:hypothetical protein OJF2_10570 [Aquisphaera giovannonii]|uniref:Uncharacterized protein n=1 Tax=Aquisphaera giovannonii TaxID=406548 RepID=A0A5B9VY85_9BACT|nr:hypothetical protein [Aquisphaera giovannonii]QEH32580.1 hypothetical protein OJF2_10570 [Aquisphaera giovannonii]
MDDMGRVLQQLTHEMRPPSIRMVIHVEQSKFEASMANTSRPLTMDRTYIETGKGQRYFDDIARIAGGGTSRKTAYSDGRRSANIMYSPKDDSTVQAVNIGHEFMGETGIGYYSAPEPFRYTRVGLIPLLEALPRAEKLGPATVAGRVCDRYLFREVKGGGLPQSLVYALDRATSVPLMVAAYKDVEHVHSDLPSWVWEAVTLDEISSYHFPLRSKQTVYFLSSDGGREVSRPDMTQTIEVKSLEYDVVYPTSTFWPNPGAGVDVFDSITRKHSVTPGAVTPKATAVGVADPIRADPSDTGAWPVWPVVALSCVTFAAALVFKVRDRWQARP